MFTTSRMQGRPGLDRGPMVRGNHHPQTDRNDCAPGNECNVGLDGATFDLSNLTSALPRQHHHQQHQHQHQHQHQRNPVELKKPPPPASTFASNDPRLETERPERNMMKLYPSYGSVRDKVPSIRDLDSLFESGALDSPPPTNGSGGYGSHQQSMVEQRGTNNLRRDEFRGNSGQHGYSSQSQYDNAPSRNNHPTTNGYNNNHDPRSFERTNQAHPDRFSSQNQFGGEGRRMGGEPNRFAGAADRNPGYSNSQFHSTQPSSRNHQGHPHSTYPDAPARNYQENSQGYQRSMPTNFQHQQDFTPDRSRSYQQEYVTNRPSPPTNNQSVYPNLRDSYYHPEYSFNQPSSTSHRPQNHTYDHSPATNSHSTNRPQEYPLGLSPPSGYLQDQAYGRSMVATINQQDYNPQRSMPSSGPLRGDDRYQSTPSSNHCQQDTYDRGNQSHYQRRSDDSRPSTSTSTSTSTRLTPEEQARRMMEERFRRTDDTLGQQFTRIAQKPDARVTSGPGPQEQELQSSRSLSSENQDRRSNFFRDYSSKLSLRPSDNSSSSIESFEIEISPGVHLPMRGANETERAVRQGQLLETPCFCCQTQLFCVKSSEFICCPICCVVGPIETTSSGAHGVGLGLTQDMVDDILRF